MSIEIESVVIRITMYMIWLFMFLLLRQNLSSRSMGGAEASVPIVKVTHEAPVSNNCS